MSVDDLLVPWTTTAIWSNPDAARADATAALDLCEPLAYTDGQARDTMVLAGTSIYEGKCRDGETLLDRAEQLFASTGNEIGQAELTSFRSFLWLEREDFVTALDRLPAALEIARRHKNIELETEILNDIGTQFHISGQMEASSEHLFAALALSRKLASRVWEAYLTMNIGATLLERPEIDDAAKWLRQALDIFESIDDGSGIAYCCINLAQYEELRGRPQQALVFLERALLEARDSRGVATILLELGRIRADLDDIPGAIDAFRRCANEHRTYQDEHRAAWAALADWQTARHTHEWSAQLLADLQGGLSTIQGSGGSLRSAFTFYEALIETSRHLGYIEMALDYSLKSTDAKDQHWRNLAEHRSVLASKMHQLHHAQSTAEREREQRVALEKLNQTNEALVVQLREQTVLLERQATEDSLTLLGNRRFFDDHLEREVVRAARFGRPLTVALADIDQFKQVNDRFSHRIGDQVLVQVAHLLRSSVRETDVIARYGGEEFAFMFPETERESADEISERIRSVIQDFDWSCIAPGLAVTISIGVVSGQESISASRLLSSADALLYLAKHRGRNQVRSQQMGTAAIDIERPTGTNRLASPVYG